MDLNTGDLYICETGRSAVHKLVYPFTQLLNGSATVVVSTMITVAGIRGFSGFSGDLGPATSAKLDFPASVVVIPTSVNIGGISGVDGGGGGGGGGTNLFICDWYNNRIRLVIGVITAEQKNNGQGQGAGQGQGVGSSINNGWTSTGTITTVAGGGVLANDSGNGDGGPGRPI